MLEAGLVEFDGLAVVHVLAVESQPFALRAVRCWGDGVLAILFARQFSVRAVEADQNILVVDVSRASFVGAVLIFGDAGYDG